MTLPTSRDLTLAPGTQIPSSLLNNLQDAIIGGKHGPLTFFLSSIDGFTDGTPSGVSGYVELAANNEVYKAIALPFGTQITAIDVYVEMSNLADTFDTGLSAGVDGFVGTTGLVTSATTTIEKISAPTLLPYTLLITGSPASSQLRNYRMSAATPGNAGTVRIYGWDITISKA